MKMLEAENLTVRYGVHEIVKKVSFTVEEGQWFMLVGPNGAGKSTILNAISGGAAYTGNLRCMGKDIRRFSRRELAQTMAILSQGHGVGYDFSVREVVALGRYAYKTESPAEKEEHIRNAMEITGITDLAEKSVLHLSGGELQRTFLAQVFAQEPKILILDEPTRGIDVGAKYEIYQLIIDLANKGKTVIVVSSEMPELLGICDRIVVMSGGRVAGEVDGQNTTQEEIMTLAAKYV